MFICAGLTFHFTTNITDTRRVQATKVGKFAATQPTHVIPARLGNKIYNSFAFRFRGDVCSKMYLIERSVYTSSFVATFYSVCGNFSIEMEGKVVKHREKLMKMHATHLIMFGILTEYSNFTGG